MEQQPTWMAEKLVGALEQIAELSARVTSLEADKLSRETDERDEANRGPLRHSVAWQIAAWVVAAGAFILAWIRGTPPPIHH